MNTNKTKQQLEEVSVLSALITESIKNQLEEVRLELNNLLVQTCGDSELRAMFNDTICELKAKEALLKSSL